MNFYDLPNRHLVSPNEPASLYDYDYRKWPLRQTQTFYPPRTVRNELIREDLRCPTLVSLPYGKYSLLHTGDSIYSTDFLKKPVYSSLQHKIPRFIPSHVKNIEQKSIYGSDFQPCQIPTRNILWQKHPFEPQVEPLDDVTIYKRDYLKLGDQPQTEPEKVPQDTAIKSLYSISYRPFSEDERQFVKSRYYALKDGLVTYRERLKAREKIDDLEATPVILEPFKCSLRLDEKEVSPEKCLDGKKQISDSDRSSKELHRSDVTEKKEPELEESIKEESSQVSEDKKNDNVVQFLGHTIYNTHCRGEKGEPSKLCEPFFESFQVIPRAKMHYLNTNYRENFKEPDQIHLKKSKFKEQYFPLSRFPMSANTSVAKYDYLEKKCFDINEPVLLHGKKYIPDQYYPPNYSMDSLYRSSYVNHNKQKETESYRPISVEPDSKRKMDLTTTYQSDYKEETSIPTLQFLPYIDKYLKNLQNKRMARVSQNKVCDEIVT